MGNIELVIEGIGNQGEPDAVLKVSSFSWGPDLRQLLVMSEVTDFSAQIAVIQLVDDARNAVLRCIDDAGTEFHSYTCTGASVRDYVIAGSEGAQPIETYTLQCTSIEMASGIFVAIAG